MSDAGADPTTDPRELLGEWEFDRVVDDHLADERIGVVGTAEFTLEDDGAVRWAEQGTMTRAGAEIPISRVLFLRERDEGWVVTFDDGRDFHPWQPGAQVEHPCGRDTYRGFVQFAGPQEWSVRWHATGPEKDYEMLTRLHLRPS